MSPIRNTASGKPCLPAGIMPRGKWHTITSQALVTTTTLGKKP